MDERYDSVQIADGHLRPRPIQNYEEHLRLSVLGKQLTAKSC